MHNCVRDMAGDVLKGRSYFYHWSGAEPATVMLERYPDRGWVLAEARGAWNDTLSPWTRYVIAERVWYQRGIVLGQWDESPPFPGQFGSAVPRLLQDGEGEADAA